MSKFSLGERCGAAARLLSNMGRALRAHKGDIDPKALDHAAVWLDALHLDAERQLGKLGVRPPAAPRLRYHDDD